MKITRYPLASYPASKQFVPADFLADPDGFSADSVTAFEQLVEAAGFNPEVDDVRVGALAAPFGEHLPGAAVVCRLEQERMVGRYFAVVDLLNSVGLNSVGLNSVGLNSVGLNSAGLGDSMRVGDWQSHAVAPPCVAANSVHDDVQPANMAELAPYPVRAA